MHGSTNRMQANDQLKRQRLSGSRGRTCDDAQQGRLAAAIRADHCQALTPPQRQRHVGEQVPLTVVGAPHAL